MPAELKNRHYIFARRAEGRGKYHRGNEEIGVGWDGSKRQEKFTWMSRMDRIGKRDGGLLWR
jgi:hypothetical protein